MYDAKVSKDSTAIAIEENIGRFHIAMDTTMLLMGVVQSRSDLFKIHLGLIQGEWPMPVQILTQGATGYIGHNNIRKAILFAIGIYRENVGMIKLTGGGCFAQETTIEISLHLDVHIRMRQKDLNCHFFVGLSLLSQKNSTGTAIAQLLLNDA